MSQDKPAAVLTNAQREYLQGEKEYRPKNERQVRKRIRDRVEQGTADFTTLYGELDDDEMQMIFGSGFAQPIEKHQEERNDVPSQRNTAASVAPAIAFFMRGLDVADEPIYEGLEESDEPQPVFKRFTGVLEQAISMYLFEEKNYDANVSVDIELNGLTPSDELFSDNTE